MSRQSKPLEATVLLIDVGQTVSQQNQDDQNFFSRSKLCASRIVQRKIFSDGTDQFSLVLVGSEETENELDYQNINVKYKYLTSPSWKMLKDIENLNATCVNSGDWMDGLVVAINLLKGESECKRFTDKKIVMMSNFASPIRSKDQIDDIISAIEELKINLVVIGLQTEDENSSSNESIPLKSKTQRKGEALISRIVDEVEGVICGFDEAMEQLNHFQKVTSKPQPWNCDLQIADIFIPITAYKKFSEKKLLNWKKRSVDNASVIEETVYFDGDNQVEKSDVINSYLFGQTVIPISDDDKASMALSTEKCLQLLGFTKKTNVPRHMLLGDSVFYVVPSSGCESAAKAVTALVKALLELEMVAIVRRVQRKNAAPCVGVLVPTCEKNSYVFYYAQLPFAEDERFTKLPSLKKVQPRKAQLDAVDELIDAMDLSQLDEDEDPYNKLVNPTVEHAYNLITIKALHPELTLDGEPSETIRKLLCPLPEILENASTALEKIKRLFPLEEVEQKSYRRGAADVFNRSSTSTNPNAMEVDEDVKTGNLADSMASFVQSTVTEVGTVNPEGNFLKLLESGEPFEKLCEQMQIAIRKLLLTTSSAVGVQKPLSALALLRTKCVKLNPVSYNIFIASLKDDLVERNNEEVWDKIVADKLGLITSVEAEESNITIEEGGLFYEIKKNESLSENYEMEAEDMLDMI